jgi:hypothetical protein
MRCNVVMLSICLLSACAGSPPAPPSAKGEYRPINKPETQKSASAFTTAAVFNFNFEGDIVDALVALHSFQPQLNVSPPLGKTSPLPVRINLRNTTLENALRSIGEQGGDIADVVWKLAPGEKEGQAFIRFRAISQRATTPVANSK